MRHVNKIEADKVNTITIEDDSYPRLLKGISDPPPVLYVKGEIHNNKRVGQVFWFGNYSSGS